MNRLRRSVAVLLAGCSLTPRAWADDLTLQGNFSSGTTTRFPTPLPSNGQTTTFTTFSGSAVPYITDSFYVSQSGTVTATLSGLSDSNSPVAVGAYFVTGTFSPNPLGPSVTPLDNFVVGQQGFPSTTISAILQPGIQYSYLLLFSSGTTGVSTLMLSAPGCIGIGSSCGDFVSHSTRVTGGVAALLDDLIGSAPAALAAAINDLAQLGDSEQTAALERLIPVPMQPLMVASRTAMQRAFDRIDGRLAALRTEDRARFDSRGGLASVAAGGTPQRQGFWLNSYGLAGRESQRDGFAGLHSHGWGVTVGADREFSDSTVGGVSVSYSDTELSFHNQRVGDRSGAKSRQVSLYGSRDFSVAYLDAVLAYSWQRYESRRDTTVSGIAHGRFAGDQWGLRIGMGTRRALPFGAAIQPRASLEWNRINQDDYSESRGGPLALNVDSNHARRWRTSLGFEISRNTLLSDETRLEPYLRTFWNRDLKNDGVRSAASFTGGGTAFSAPGQELERDSFSAGVGVRLYQGEGFSASLGWDVTLSSQNVTQVPQLSARWQF